MMSAIVKLFGALAIYVSSINILAVKTIGGDEISLAAIEICSRIAAIYNGVFIEEIIKNFKLKDSMDPQFVNVNAFSAKYRSKREIYSFLTVDGEVYSVKIIMIQICRPCHRDLVTPHRNTAAAQRDLESACRTLIRCDRDRRKLGVPLMQVEHLFRG